MDSQFEMESNGNGALDHMTSSPTSQTLTQPITGYFHRYQRLHAQRLEYDRLFEDLLTYTAQTEARLREDNDALRSSLNDSHLDLADATKSRRELQQRVEQLENQVMFMSSKNDYLKNYNPYVVVLIDGDGCHFQKRFIEQGIDGGKQAAYALRNAILKDCHGPTGSGGDVEVIARFIANLSGLSYITRASGTVENELTIKQFTSGFTQAMASFDFIDVGSGKERADTKIKGEQNLQTSTSRQSTLRNILLKFFDVLEAIRWHLKNHNCRQIVVGISFDSGYASFLDEVLRDDDSRQRITILEGPPSHRDISAHRLRTLNLNDEILRFEKLEALPNQFVDRRLSNVTPMTITPPATIAGMSPLPPPPATPSNAISNSNGAVASNGAPPSSYATAIKAASPPPQVTLPIPPKQVKPAKTPVRSNKAPAWNPGVRGLDPPLEVNQSALDNIKKRKDHNKLCNNHYLRGPCAKGDACCFEHKYRPNEMEKTAIAFLARLNPCTSGQDCEVDDCIYGHHCPSTRDGLCTHPFCKFKPWEHPPNTKFKQTYQYADEE